MIAKAILGDSFRAVCFYLCQESKDAQVLAAEGVRTDSAQHMAEDFTFQRQLRPTLGKAVLHVALSLPPEDAVGRSPEEVSQLLEKAGRAYRQELAKEKGIGPLQTQWVLVQHFDKGHPHAHLVLNRVDDQGQVISDKFIGQRSRHACQRVEQQLGLATAEARGQEQARREGPTNRQQAARTPREVRLANRQRARHVVANALKAAAGSENFGELADKLALQRIKQVVSEHRRADGSVGYGVRFECDGHRFKGGEVGPAFTAPQLLASFAQARVERQAQASVPAKAAKDRPAEEQLTAPAMTAPAKGERVVTQRTAEPLQPPAQGNAVPLAGPAGVPKGAASGEAGRVPESLIKGVSPLVVPTTGEGIVRELGQPAASATPNPLRSAGEAQPAVRPVTEAQRQAAIYRAAAAGEPDALDQAKVLVQQLLTKALVTTETTVTRIKRGLHEQGFDFHVTKPLIRHRESLLVLQLTDVQPGGANARPFMEQVAAVAQANQMAERERARQATVDVLVEFLRVKPHFTDRAELTAQLAKVGLAVSWPGHAAGVGGTLTLTHVALEHSFAHEELPVHGQPLLPQLNAAKRINLASPVQEARVYGRDEAQAAAISEALTQQGVLLLPGEPGNARSFVASYRLDSPKIAEIDLIFCRIKRSDGARVEESDAAAHLRDNAALQVYLDENSNAQQYEP